MSFDDEETLPGDGQGDHGTGEDELPDSTPLDETDMPGDVDELPDGDPSADGEPDDGEPGDGEPDDGEPGDGEPDDGEPEAPIPDPADPCSFDPGKAYLVGRFGANSPYFGVMDLADHSRVCSGMTAFASGYIRRDGRLVYLDRVAGEVRVLVGDEWTWSEELQRHELVDPEANDPVIATLTCPEYEVDSGLFGRPDSDAFVFMCSEFGGPYQAYWSDTLAPAAALEDEIEAAGYGGGLIGTRWLPDYGTGMLFPPDGEPFGASGFYYRATPTGFKCATSSTLSEVGYDQSNTQLGTFASPPAGVSTYVNNSVISAANELYRLTQRPDLRVNVLRVPLAPGVATFLYEEPTDDYETDVTVAPPKLALYPFKLVSGP